ncbi:MAG: hypothetical protein LBD59_05955 [Prevotellaceae bacterium]|jgi:hypothetical protein|nr:hypothetical protein [Prevotellaceae bacterium]
MNTDILVIIIAFCLLLVASVYLTVHRLLLADERRRNIELLKTSKSLTVPMRLQAYERLILFLERISPDAMLLKLKNQAQTNADLHLAILQNIRFEYEHNISQQLYVSNEIWALVRETKDAVAIFVSDVAKQTEPSHSSIELANKLLNKIMECDEPLVAATIREIKAEATKIM